mgnify:CR=1 FL=1
MAKAEKMNRGVSSKQQRGGGAEVKLPPGVHSIDGHGNIFASLPELSRVTPKYFTLEQIKTALELVLNLGEAAGKAAGALPMATYFRPVGAAFQGEGATGRQRRDLGAGGGFEVVWFSGQTNSQELGRRGDQPGDNVGRLKTIVLSGL